ncbi:MAG: acyl carrier protein [Gammaproteobacteria bacterium]|nr:MAG: acyl carrier protein [Gammaproteobacteria bacterium]
MSYIEEVKKIIADILDIHDQIDEFDGDTPLLGHIPELDSMAVVSIISDAEEHFGISMDDDEITAEAFETIGSFAELVERKVGG